jgi:hypothetical protein
MIKKYPPQRDASAGVYSQVAGVALQLWKLADDQLGGDFSVAHLVPRDWKDVPIMEVGV